MSYLVLDTDVASGILRHRLPSTLRGQLVGPTLAITFVTLGELTKWALVRHWGPSKRSTFDEFLAGLVVLPYSARVAPAPGRAASARAASRPTATGERHVDRGVLSGARAPIGDAQRQGLRRLRPARGLGAGESSFAHCQLGSRSDSRGGTAVIAGSRVATRGLA